MSGMLRSCDCILTLLYTYTDDATRFLFSGCFIQYSSSKWRLKAMRNEKKSILRVV